MKSGGRWGGGEMGGWGDGEMGRWGDGEMGKKGKGKREKGNFTFCLLPSGFCPQ